MDDERRCVTQALGGDQCAFAQLVDRYQTAVYNLCYRMLGTAPEAEDAAQETFIRVYRHLDAYDPQQKLSSWILSVASHHCIDRLRRRRIKWLSLEDMLPADLVASDVAPPEDTILEGEACAEIRSLLHVLPPPHRLVIVLRYWQDLSYTEIAQIVGTSESAVKSQLFRARQMMAKQILARRKLGAYLGQAQGGKKVSDHAVL